MLAPQENLSIISNSEDFNLAGLNTWEKMILKFDKNNNGLYDHFEDNLSSIIKSLPKTSGTGTEIEIIIQFPEKYDYSLATSLFKKYGGTIINTYEYVINGFSGSIKIDKFFQFYDHLKQADIPIFIEQNEKYKTNLYYTSLSLNLRPYVWKDLDGGYKGDRDGSIAIMDTGIDVSHTFFDNYSDDDPDYKIIGWNDEVNDLSDPYDDDGHGSHCAGIAAGQGPPEFDLSSRAVSTVSQDLDFTTYPYPIPDGSYLKFDVFRFNVTNSGKIQVELNYTDITFSNDQIQGWFYLKRGNSVVNSSQKSDITREENLTYFVDSDSLGIYTLNFYGHFEDNTNNGFVENPHSIFRATIHWPFDPPTLGCGNVWQGVAPKTHLVGVKTSDITNVLAGIEWIVKNRDVYNITVLSMSFGWEFAGLPISVPSVINAVDYAVENGTVVVVAAGNYGPGGNLIGSPADADNAIAVTAMNFKDQITSYSSQGGPSYSGNTVKPDITAPGGSSLHLPIYSADTNYDDGDYYSDYFINDTMSAQGTSMAAPAVAGAANLLIEAMGGGGNSWDWNTGKKSKLVKALLLMTATETAGLRREGYTSFYPTLERGYKDVHEGYGRVNIDAAIEAWTVNLTSPINITKMNIWLNTSSTDPYGKHATAGYLNLVKDQNYLINLTVPAGADYDLYLYNNTPNIYGEPIPIALSVSSTKGKDEIINYTATHDGKFFLVAKAIGDPIIIISEEEDDDNGRVEDEMTLFEFLLSPLGLLIIFSCVAAVIIIALLIKKAVSKKRDDYEFIDYEFNNNIN
ncbi:MAG: hypothetical protein EU529_03540 [Promethearchaeota archaeon]|nr:MAG: hypothetical protein EU529_03540 [Candidatus Lokiarchaeota archaeon]